MSLISAKGGFRTLLFFDCQFDVSKKGDAVHFDVNKKGDAVQFGVNKKGDAVQFGVNKKRRCSSIWCQ